MGFGNRGQTQKQTLFYPIHFLRPSRSPPVDRVSELQCASGSRRSLLERLPCFSLQAPSSLEAGVSANFLAPSKWFSSGRIKGLCSSDLSQLQCLWTVRLWIQVQWVSWLRKYLTLKKAEKWSSAFLRMNVKPVRWVCVLAFYKVVCLEGWFFFFAAAKNSASFNISLFSKEFCSKSNNIALGEYLSPHV